MRSRYSALRTVDVARRSGYSVQQIRKLSQTGVLPPAERTPTGHRRYTEQHLRAVRAYRQLAVGIGPTAAALMLRAWHRSPAAELLARLDAEHARLDAERRALELAAGAVGAIADEAIEDVSAGDALTVSELAAALGVRPSTLRHWDAEGLIVPRRDSAREPRRYAPTDVRDARIVHQLRLAGYRIHTLRRLLPDLRAGGDDLDRMLADRRQQLTVRSRAMLAAAADLHQLLPDR